MEYYVVDKCYKGFDNYKLDIYAGRNKEIGTSLRPISSKKSKKPESIHTIDFSKPVVHTLYDHDMTDRITHTTYSFNKLYVKDVQVNPNIIGMIDLHDDIDYNDQFKFMYDNRFQKSYPKIMLSYTITTQSHNYYEGYKYHEFAVNGKEFVYSFKPENFKDNIDLHLTAHCEKNMTYKDDEDEKTHCKCTIDTKLTGTSEITFNGNKYLFDANNVTNIFCVNTMYCHNEIAWVFVCTVKLDYIDKPIVTKVTENQFKRLDKHDADIVIYKNKTFLMKNTTNNNVVFDYSDIKNDSDLVKYIEIDSPENYLSTCRNCSNCYNCKYCWNCNNCKSCSFCKNCDTCDNCYNSQYCKNCIECKNETDMIEKITSNTNNCKYCDMDVYNDYVSQYCVNQKYVVAITSTVVAILGIVGYYIYQYKR